MKSIDSNNFNTEKPQSPGSFNEFCSSRNLSSEQALGYYSLALDEYRGALAEYHGISLEDLHLGPFNYEQASNQ